MGLIEIYRKKSYEEKVKINAILATFVTFILFIGKILFTFWSGSYLFLTSALVSLLMAIARFECLMGIKKRSKGKEFTHRNIAIMVCVITAGVAYTVYMARFFYSDMKVWDYKITMAILISLVATIEIIMVIRGFFKIKKSGHFYRNIKMISFAGALTSIVLAQVAILEFTKTPDRYKYSSIFGIIIGSIIIFIGVFMFILPKVSYIDRKYNTYIYNESQEKTLELLKNYQGKIKIRFDADNKILISFYDGFFYGIYGYKARITPQGIVGKIFHKNNYIKRLHWSLKILFIILSEILIPIWLIGRFVIFIMNAYLPARLDKIMKNFDVTYVETNN